MASKQVILYVHGSGPKPPHENLLAFWSQALLQGLERSMPKAKAAFAESSVEMIHWSSQVGLDFLNYQPELDLKERTQTIEALGQMRKSRDFRRRYYDALPGKSALKEFAMDSAAVVGAGGMVWPKVMPALASYWQDANGWAERVRAELTERLVEHDRAGHKILLMSHCMGSVLAYDALCQAPLVNPGPVWITMGSPLASNTVRKRLLGMSEGQYPENLTAWHNIAAEDDYVCHDKSVADDFKPMLDRGLLEDIRDHAIYNLATRDGYSTPHHSAGYLTHPRVAGLVGQWLLAKTDS